jgi:hypothetical protein
MFGIIGADLTVFAGNHSNNRPTDELLNVFHLESESSTKTEEERQFRSTIFSPLSADHVSVRARRR